MPAIPLPHLNANLSVLDAVNPCLAGRIRLPVVGDHVVKDPAGGLMLRIDGQPFDLQLDPPTLRASLEAVAGEDDVLLFGVGAGCTLPGLLSSRPTRRVVAWDRDPWLMRLLLGRHDLRAELLGGRLTLRLGADLLDTAPTMPRVIHPLLGQLYVAEHELLDRQPRHPHAVVVRGGLFVDDLVEALQDLGFGVYVLDASRVALGEVDHTLSRLEPLVVACINYTRGLAELCHAHGTRLICWEIDPSTDALTPVDTPTDDARIFTYRRAHLDEFQRSGFRHVEHLPLAANPARRRPLALSADEAARYACDVSFVGSSMTRQAAVNRARFVRAYALWRQAPDAAAHAEAGIDAILQDQRASFDEDRVTSGVQERFGDFLQAMADAGARLDLVALVAEQAASERRLHHVGQLARFGVHVWGDDGWQRLEADGVRWRGRAGHRHELTRIYNASAINVDVGRLYQRDIVTMRVLDVLACGAFVLAEHSDDLVDLLQPDVEVASWRTLEELEDKVAWYLANPDEARAIAERGREAVLSRHTIRARVRYMLETLAPAATAADPASLD